MVARRRLSVTFVRTLLLVLDYNFYLPEFSSSGLCLVVLKFLILG